MPQTQRKQRPEAYSDGWPENTTPICNEITPTETFDWPHEIAAPRADRHWLSIALSAIVGLGFVVLLVHFAGLLATLLGLGVVFVALVFWGNWILDNTIEL